ncbi:MAG: ATP-grasp domain-containing protein [Roseomonas sp.]|nr:ATP-grasp domain-containing protein [Roseomonas sp.]
MKSSDQRVGAIVDAYSTGRHLAAELAPYGIKLVHVQSSAEILSFDLPSFRPRDFLRNLIFEGRESQVSRELAAIRPEFVVAGCESGVMVADTLAEALGTPGNGTFRSQARRDKALMAQAVAEAGLRTIKHIVTSSPKAALAWKRLHNLEEIVIKPTNSAGTDDVFFCATEDEIIRSFSAIIGKINAMGSRNSEALVQERVEGRQFTANTVSHDGRHYLVELWSYETVRVAGAGSLCDHEMLLDGGDAEVLTIAPYVFGVLDALHIRYGPAHVELFLDRKGPVLIEIGARMQGSMSRTARQAALGHDHVMLTALCLADPSLFTEYVRTNTPYRRRRHAVIVSILSDRSGRVLGHSGLSRVRTALTSFSDAFAFPCAGEELAVSRDLATTAGIVYLVHEDRALVESDFKMLKATPIEQLLDLAPGSGSGTPSLQATPQRL